MIKLKNLLSSLAIFILSSYCFSASNLTVNFDGELINTSCQISSDTMNKNIILNNLRLKNINENGISGITPFFISIDNCSESDLEKNVKLTWVSNNLVNIDGQNFLITEGDSGVLLGLTDKDNNPVVWNKPFSIGAVSISEYEQNFNFSVFARKPISGNAKVGDFLSIVTFKLEYE